jgi:hypothetical protein
MEDERTNREGGGSLRLAALSLFFTILISAFNLTAFFIGCVGMLVLSAFNWLKRLFATH